MDLAVWTKKIYIIIILTDHHRNIFEKLKINTPSLFIDVYKL